MKRVLALLIICCLSLLVGCRHTAVTPPDTNRPPDATTLAPVDPVVVVTKPTEQTSRLARPVNITWISRHLSEDTSCSIDMWPQLIMPGEAVKLEFERDPDRAQVEYFLSQGIGDSTQYQLEWQEKAVLLSLIDSCDDNLVFGTAETDYWGWYAIAPAQKLVVLADNSAIVFSVDIPISTNGAIGMTSDHTKVRLARLVNLGWLHIGVQEYVFDIHTQNIDPERLHSYGVMGVGYLDLDWADRTHEVTSNIHNYWRSAAGLSNSGSLLATYEHEGVRITDLLTKHSQVFSVDSIQHYDLDFSNPQRVFWSYDDQYLIYTASIDKDLADNLYLFDVTSGTETMLLKGHHVRSVSPYSSHIFTSTWGSSSLIYHIVDEAGNTIRLNEPSESIALTKWIDKNRILVNKSTDTIYSGLIFNSNCYIYHIDENRWEYICEGYGFDYDTATGRVFVLQNR